MSLAPRIKRTVPGKSVVKADAKKERTAQAHVDLVKLLPCAITGRKPADAHHLMRTGESGARGTGLKTAGRWTVPLCRPIHTEITPQGDPEAYLMANYGLDARSLALALWAASPDLDAMERAVYRASVEAMRRL